MGVLSVTPPGESRRCDSGQRKSKASRGGAGPVTSRSLDEWHAHLADRFAQLRKERDAVRPGSPIFALEHGLSLGDDLPELQAAVRRAVGRPRLPRTCGLPFVVYAAEVGYGYQGDEFWPGFEEATPGWTSHGVDTARRFIRHQFEDFAETYGGALISGRWARWFKNIAWPITHAVLAKDLQRHLARLLYDYRNALTSELLEDHAALGEQLARRSSDTSARFRNFAENTELLGLVAAALLLGEEDDTQLLTPEVLSRLVSDLSRERRAGAWLADAKRAAVRVRLKGLQRGGSAGGGTAEPRAGVTSPAIEASLSLRRGPEGWKPYVVIPSHAPLAERVSAVREVIERSRYRIEGVAGVQPTGALMYDRGPVPLQAWPAIDGAPLVSVEPAGTGADPPGLLADHCRMPAEPWLFRITEPGIARHVRTRTVRPDNEYICIRRDRTTIDGVQCEAVDFAVSDAHALKFTVPSVVDKAATTGLVAAGLSVAPEVTLTPVGLVPAAWDGEGLAEWPAGESPMLAIRSSRSVARCIAATDTEVKEFDWPDDSDTILLQLAEPAPGTRAVSVRLLDEAGEVLAQGSVIVTLRDPVDSATTATARQGMQVRAFPPHPTLTTLWAGESRLEITGPAEERVKFTIRLAGGRGGMLGHNTFSSQLPVSVDRWWELLRGARREHGLDDVVDQADEFIVGVEHPSLGHAEVHTRRPFEPIRWVVGHDRRGPFGRLVNHTAATPVLQFFPAEQPASCEEIPYEDDKEFRFTSAGLIYARCDDIEAATIIPPQVSGGLDALGLLNVRPTLQTGPRSLDSVQRALALARLWGSLPTQVDPSGSMVQSRVLSAIRARLGGLIGGSYWWEVEKAVLDERQLTTTKLRSGIARGAHERGIAEGILERRRGGADLARLTDFYCTAMAVQCRWLPDSTARVVAAMARAPEGVDSEDEQVVTAIREVLDRPATFRLARFLSLVEAVEFVEEGRSNR